MKALLLGLLALAAVYAVALAIAWAVRLLPCEPFTAFGGQLPAYFQCVYERRQR